MLIKPDKTAAKSILGIILVTALLLAGLDHFSYIGAAPLPADNDSGTKASSAAARRTASAEDHRKNVWLAGKSTDNKVLAAGAVVEIDEETYLIEDTYDKDYMWREVEYALARRFPVICFKDYEVKSMDELFALDYGSFWAESISWHTEEYDDGTYYFYRINYYDLTDEEIENMKSEIDYYTEQAVDSLPYCSDEWEAAKAVHDYLIANITYDESLALPHTHDLYGALVNHEAVCSAYSSAFCHLMRKLGYDNVKISYSESHTWNKVITNTHDRYVDATWDDLDETDSYGYPYIDYSYFFIDYDVTSSIESHKFADSESSYADEGSFADYVDYNYYIYNNYYLTDYDQDEISNMLRYQIESGTNSLTLRFCYYEDYQRAVDACRSGDIMSGTGYDKAFIFWINDDVLTVTIGLDPK